MLKSPLISAEGSKQKQKNTDWSHCVHLRSNFNEWKIKSKPFIRAAASQNSRLLGQRENSPVIKGELRRCNTSKTSLSKRKKKRRGVERGGMEIRAFRKRREETLIKAALRVWWWKQTEFPSEPALIMRSCWGTEQIISAVNVFNMAVKMLSHLASSRHIISSPMPVISHVLFSSVVELFTDWMPERRRWPLDTLLTAVSVCVFLPVHAHTH